MIISHWFRGPSSRCDNWELRRSYITHCEWHKALLPLAPAPLQAHSHDRQRHLFSNSKKTPKIIPFYLSDLSINNTRQRVVQSSIDRNFTEAKTDMFITIIITAYKYMPYCSTQVSSQNERPEGVVITRAQWGSAILKRVQVSSRCFSS